ncbi:MAG: STAS domain-containing protein [Planctomycetota bacterium]|jgi:anti-sigma B factor antagonist
MFKLFGRQTHADDPTRRRSPARKLAGGAAASDDVPTAPKGHDIAEMRVVGQTIMATLTVTELADDMGASRLADLLEDLASCGARHLVLDIQNVQFMNSACLGCLVETLNKIAVNGGKIALVNPAQSVQSLFRLTRLDRVFLIHHDVMTALDAVEGRPRD